MQAVARTEQTERQFGTLKYNGHKAILKKDGLIDQANLDLDMIFEELCSRKVDWICAINAEAEYNQNDNCIQKSHTLEYKVIYDDNMYDEFGQKNTAKKIQEIMAHVSTKFCHESLGTKIELKVSCIFCIFKNTISHKIYFTEGGKNETHEGSKVEK